MFCLRCNSELRELRFCTSHQKFAPTPECQICADCLCTDPFRHEAFYSSVEPAILESIPGRNQFIHELVEMFSHSSPAIENARSFQGHFYPGEMNQLLEAFSSGVPVFLRECIEKKLVPVSSILLPYEKDSLGNLKMNPVRLFEFQKKRILFLVGSQYSIRQLGGIDGDPGTIYIGFPAGKEILQQVQKFWNEEPDYQPLLASLRDWIEEMQPEYVVFQDHAPPRMLIGKRLLTYSKIDQFPGRSVVREFFERAPRSGVLHRFQDESQDELLLYTEPDHIDLMEWIEPACNQYFSDLLLSVQRSSGIILVATAEAGLVGRILKGKLSREGFLVVDYLRAIEQSLRPITGNVIFADYSVDPRRIRPEQFLTLAGQAPIIAFYSGVFPELHFPEEFRISFEDLICSHYLFTTFRPVHRCAAASTTYDIPDPQIQVELFEPEGCDACSHAGYMPKRLLILPYSKRFPSREEVPAVDSTAVRKLFENNPRSFDFYYASKIFSSKLLRQKQEGHGEFS